MGCPCPLWSTSLCSTQLNARQVTLFPTISGRAQACLSAVTLSLGAGRARENSGWCCARTAWQWLAFADSFLSYVFIFCISPSSHPSICLYCPFTNQPCLLCHPCPSGFSDTGREWKVRPLPPKSSTLTTWHQCFQHTLCLTQLLSHRQKSITAWVFCSWVPSSHLHLLLAEHHSPYPGVWKHSTQPPTAGCRQLKGCWGEHFKQCMFWKASLLPQGQMFLCVLHLCSGLHGRETAPPASGCLQLTRHLPPCLGTGKEGKRLQKRAFLGVEETPFQTVLLVFSILIHLHFSTIPWKAPCGISKN